MFQFTLPRGERQAGAETARDAAASFNSRSRGGSDGRPRRAQTRPRPRFNSRSRGGSDGRYPMEMWPKKGFNSRSRGGSDLGYDNSSRWAAGFNSRSRGGSDRRSLASFRPTGRVSIHAPAGGATRVSESVFTG